LAARQAEAQRVRQAALWRALAQRGARSMRPVWALPREPRRQLAPLARGRPEPPLLPGGLRKTSPQMRLPAAQTRASINRQPSAEVTPD
jgi:hypothetical protein